jgi:hypothetical protein
MLSDPACCFFAMGYFGIIDSTTAETFIAAGQQRM